MIVTYVRSHHESLDNNIISFWFKPEKTIDHIAGQFIQLKIPHDNPDDRGTKRWFTLSSSPTDAPLVSVTTKFAKRSSTFKQALKHLKPGEKLHMDSPMGDFVLPKDSSIPLVFVAGGIGITPFHSIIKWLYDTKQERDITFLYAINNEHEMIFQELFEHYGLNRILIVKKPLGTWDGEVGQLDAMRILSNIKLSSDSLIYISGPEQMVESLNKQLAENGVNKNQLVGDFFPGYLSI